MISPAAAEPRPSSTSPAFKTRLAIAPRTIAATPITKPIPGQKKLERARMSELFAQSWAFTILSWRSICSLIPALCLPLAATTGGSLSENSVPTLAPQYAQLATPTLSGIPHSWQLFLSDDISVWGRSIECSEALFSTPATLPSTIFSGFVKAGRAQRRELRGGKTARTHFL